MPHLLTIANKHLVESLLISSAVLLTLLLISLVARRIALGFFARKAEKAGGGAELILDSIRFPSLYWAVALSLYIALDTSRFPVKYVNYGLGLLYIVIIISVSLAVANIGSGLLQNAIRKSETGMPATGLLKTVIRVTILSIGILVMLNGLGISITPILTALGVGGLAVALALQDTLSNLFAGIHLLLEKAIAVGDHIKLNTGEEGLITDIGWRSTRIREFTNNTIIVPNNKLSQAIVTNMPDKRLFFSLKISVSYDSDPDKVEEMLVDEAVRAAEVIKGLIKEPVPTARLVPGFGDYSLEFTLTCEITVDADRLFAQHELRKRILKRFKKEGIEIPKNFPR